VKRLPLLLVAILTAAGCGGGARRRNVSAFELHARFQSYVRDPSPEAFAEIRELLVASRYYQPYTTDLLEAGKLLKAQKNAEALACLRKAMPNYLLSARAHTMLAVAANRLGRMKLSADEALASRRCLEGIMQSGDGTREKPYRVLSMADEHDVLRALGKRGGTQEHVTVGKRHLDIHTFPDGSEVAFDVTPCMERLRDAFREPVRSDKAINEL
jgi:hypothetical protein